MSSSEVSAVLFAKDQARVSTFYRDALGFTFVASGDDHSIFDCDGFEFVVHQIPQHLMGEASGGSPARRGNSPLRLNFPVDDIDTARSKAESLGGQVDASPPPWADSDANFFLGHDPEGNVFKVSQR